jgi:hypothetical protein
MMFRRSIEAFSIFKRLIRGASNTDFSSDHVELIATRANTPRQMQVGPKCDW